MCSPAASQNSVNFSPTRNMVTPHEPPAKVTLHTFKFAILLFYTKGTELTPLEGE
jgi:hypothetical protein